MYVIETGRLRLRRLAEEDAPFILELVNDPDWLRFIGDRGVRDLDDARRYVVDGPVASYGRHGYGLYLVETREDAAPAGICGLVRREWLEEADLGFAFLPRFRGRGLAREAARATLEYAAGTLGLERISAIVSPGNEASLRLLRELGFGSGRRVRPPGGDDEVCLFTYRRNPMRITRTLTTLYVRDLDRAAPWYERLFGRTFDRVPMPSCREWDTTPGATVQVISKEERAGETAVALVVEELDGVLAALRAGGIEAGAVEEVPGFVRYSLVRDPDGNEVTLVESIAE
ncbi:MAG TPA: GNAT family N-acetyltransferase [Longimicrobiaceae bacterium]